MAIAGLARDPATPHPLKDRPKGIGKKTRVKREQGQVRPKKAE